MHAAANVESIRVLIPISRVPFLNRARKTVDYFVLEPKISIDQSKNHTYKKSKERINIYTSEAYEGIKKAAEGRGMR